MALIIAEAGVNHNGSEDLALRLVEAAKVAGADVVKFQTFKTSKLVTKSAQQADYQKLNTSSNESQFTMLSRLELSYTFHHQLIDYARSLDIGFLSTAFDSESLKFLVNDLGLRRLKIPSGDLTNSPLLLEHARTGADLIVSTGMADLSEIENALGVIAFGYLAGLDESPSIGAFKEAYSSQEGQAMLGKKVTLLHCTTEYPAPFNEINLNAMNGLKSSFGLDVGYSDHSEGVAISIAAVAKGACLIEKHFTLDRNFEGPDHKASLNPEQLSLMVAGIRQVEIALGHGIKIATVSEIRNRVAARKSLMASCDIHVGELLSEDNVTTMRPGGGISPHNYWEVIGRRATIKYSGGDLIGNQGIL